MPYGSAPSPFPDRTTMNVHRTALTSQDPAPTGLHRLDRRRLLAGASALLLAGCRGGGDPSGAGATSAGAAAGTAPVAPTTAPGPTVTTVATPVTATSLPAPTGTAAVVVPDILGRPTATSVTVNVVPKAAGELRYEIARRGGPWTWSTAPVAARAGEPLEVVLDGLEPGTEYVARLRMGDGAGPELPVVTQRPRGRSFTFAVQGDSHPERVKTQFDARLYDITLRSAAAARPDFYLAIGDDFSVDTLKVVNRDTVEAGYIAQRRWLPLVGAPVFLVNGNHEQASLANIDGTPDNVAVWAQTARNRWYPQPGPDSFYGGNAEPLPHIGLLRNYFSFEWGDALFVVIDPYWHTPGTVDNAFGASRDQKKGRDLWDVTLGETQYRWFEQTLSRSSATHRFVFTHHVLGTGRGGIELAKGYEWGDAAGFATRRPGWGLPIHQLMAKHGVTVFFQGHDHIFVHQELDGVVYQTLPEPANPNETYENEDAFRSGTKFPNSGHVRVDVDPSAVTVTYVRSFLDRPDEKAYSYRVG
jgi:hypothetical protein